MSQTLPSLNALRAFEAVARHLSLTAAARELGVTPAAVKQLVTKLEAHLGAALVRRSGAGLSLTEAGEAGLAELSLGFERLQAAVDKMRESKGQSRLVITAEPFFASSWLVPRLSRFRARHPEIDVLIDSSMAVVDLARGDADLAIRYGVKPAKALSYFRLFEDCVVPVCSPRLIDGPPSLQTPADLAKTTLLHWDLSQTPSARETARWFDFGTWQAAQSGSPAVAAQTLAFTDYNHAVQAAIAGQGVLLGSWPLLKEAVEAGLLVLPFDAALTTDIGYDLAVLPSQLTVAKVRHFKDWLLEEAAKLGDANP